MGAAALGAHVRAVCLAVPLGPATLGVCAARLARYKCPRAFFPVADLPRGANGKLTLSRWQGNDCLNYSPMVYAYNQTNIALTGADWTSILNGQGGVPSSTRRTSAGGTGKAAASRRASAPRSRRTR